MYIQNGLCVSVFVRDCVYVFLLVVSVFVSVCETVSLWVFFSRMEVWKSSTALTLNPRTGECSRRDLMSYLIKYFE